MDYEEDVVMETEESSASEPETVEGVALLRSGGVCGLQNLGNTCYMNSAIQCLSHCVPLTLWYLRKEYQKDINKENPLGTGGVLAERYAETVSKLWVNHEGSSFSPMSLKKTVGKFCPMFKGFEQHDAQEFIACLLDGLHEDVNRITKKPYVEKPEVVIDGNGAITVGGYRKERIDVSAPLDQIERQLGENAWEAHMQRNQSMITELFHGQLKTRLHCADCKTTLVTFDPMMYASLTLPRLRRCILSCAVYFPSYHKPVVLFLPVTYREETVSMMGGRVQQLNSLLLAQRHEIRRDILAYFNIEVGEPSDVAMTSESLSSTTSSLPDPLAPDFEHCRQVICAAFRGGRSESLEPDSKRRKKRRDSPSERYSCSMHAVNAFLNPDASLKSEIPRTIVTISDLAPNAGSNEVECVASDATYYSILFSFCVPFPISLVGQVKNSMTLQYHKTVAVMDGGETLQSLLENELVAHLVEDYSSALIKLFIRKEERHRRPEIVRATREAIEGASYRVHSSTGAKAPSVRLPELNGEKVQTWIDHLGFESRAEHEAALTLNQVVFFGSFELRGIMEALDRNIQPVKKLSLMDLTGEMTLRKMLSKRRPVSPAGMARALTTSTTMAADDETPPSAKTLSPRRLDSGAVSLLQTMAETRLWLQSNAIKEVTPIFQWKFNLLEDAGFAFYSRAQAGAASPFMATLDTPGGNITLDDCIREFLGEEKLEENNMWYCPTCKSHVQATKKFDFFKLPQILIIHLKRFHQEGYRFRMKISSLVSFPWREHELLDLTDLVEGHAPSQYRLFAVCNHFGTLSGGHYTARARSFVNRKWKWWCYDDSRARCLGTEDELNEQEILNGSAYVLFYAKV